MSRLHDLSLPGPRSGIIDPFPTAKEDYAGRPWTVALPVFPVRVLGSGRRQDELDLFEDTVLRLLQSGVTSIPEIQGLIGLEATLIRLVLQSLVDRGMAAAAGKGSWSPLSTGRSSPRSGAQRVHAWLLFDPIAKVFLPLILAQEPGSAEVRLQDGYRVTYKVGTEGAGLEELVTLADLESHRCDVNFAALDSWQARLGLVMPELRKRHGFVFVDELQPGHAMWLVVRLYVAHRSLTPRWVVQDPLTGQRSETLRRHLELLRQSGMPVPNLERAIEQLSDQAGHIVDGEHGDQLARNAAAARARVQRLSGVPQLVADGLFSFHYELLGAQQVEGRARTERYAAAAAAAWATMEAAAGMQLARLSLNRQQLLRSCQAEHIEPQGSIDALRQLGCVIDRDLEHALRPIFRISTGKMRHMLRDLGSVSPANDLPSLWYIFLQLADVNHDSPMRKLSQGRPDHLRSLADLWTMRSRGAHSKELEHGQQASIAKVIDLVHCWVSVFTTGIMPQAGSDEAVLGDPGDNVAGRQRLHLEQLAGKIVGEQHSLFPVIVELLSCQADLMALADQGLPHETLLCTRAVDQCYRVLEQLSGEWLERWFLPGEFCSAVPEDALAACRILGITVEVDANQRRIEQAHRRQGSTMMAQVVAVIKEAAAWPEHPFRTLLEAQPALMAMIHRVSEARRHHDLGRIPPPRTAIQEDIRTILDACIHLVHGPGISHPRT